uniref:S8 family peptidase n=1 Tax=Flavobacterium sp. TaxID=239 RepID=UPI00404B41FE
MFRIFITSIVLFFSSLSWSQEDAWIYFNSKPGAAIYLENPSLMLSQAALDRRSNQNIAIDFIDVPIHQAFVEIIENQLDIEVFAQSKWLNAVHVRGTQVAIELLTNLDFVDHIEFANKQLNNSNRVAFQNHSSTKNLEVLENTINYGQATNQIEMLNGHLLHNEGFTGEGMHIAVIDNGFVGVNTTAAFQHLWDENLIVDTYNFVTRQADVFSNGTHGTAVISTMAAVLSDEFSGTAPNAFYSLFVSESNTYEDPLEESLWVEAAERADSLGVDVINTSLGYTTFDNPNYNHSYEDLDGQTTFIARGAHLASSRGIICVVSAGNSGNGSWQYIGTPADADDVLAIGAVNSQGEYATFSSIGPSADGRIKPNIVAQGAQASIINSGGTFSVTNGTSLSAPITAGLVACLWQSLPGLNYLQIIDLIESTASNFSNPNPQIGYGIPDFYQAKTKGLLSNTSIDSNNLEVNVCPNPTQSKLNVVTNNPNDVFDLTIFSLIG